MPTTQADVVALRSRNQAVVTLAKRALAQFWSTLDLSDPYGARDALLEFVPELVASYGQVAATVAADWYETVRAKDVAGSFSAVLAESAPAEQVQANVRFQATPLFGDNPGYMLATLGGSVQRHVVNAARATVRDNARRDPARPRYARVPTGKKTCAFCLMLASRGFVYASEESGGHAHDFHDHDDCEIVMDFSSRPSIKGYDPDELYSIYQSARAASGSSDIKSIAYEVRRQFPERVSDGVVSGA